jgi:hypothetical protein
MWDEALTSLLNVRIQSYLMTETSHRFSSPVGELGVEILLQTLFVDIFLQKLRRRSIFSYRDDVEKLTRTQGTLI